MAKKKKKMRPRSQTDVLHLLTPSLHFVPSVLVLHVVCGLLFPGEPVADVQAGGQPAEGGRRRRPGGCHLLLLLHLHLGKGLAGQAAEHVARLD